MARGAQKEQARQKAQKEAAKRAKGASQLDQMSYLHVSMANYKLLVQHMEAKHPKEKIPSEDSFAS
ncbi:unnamed protein product [Absidia cylindrospora]